MDSYASVSANQIQDVSAGRAHVEHKGTIKNIAVVGMEGYLRDYTITAFRMPRIGPVIIGTILRDAGYNVRVFAEGVRAFRQEDIEWMASADFVAIAALTYGANRAYALATLLRRVNAKIKILIGDVHATIMPESCLQYANYAVRGEGDETILDVLAYENGDEGAHDLSEIPGLSYWRDGKIHHGSQRERPKDIDIIADLSLVEGIVKSQLNTIVTEGRMTLPVLQASRGCPVGCKFCLGSAILGRKYRRGSVERVIENLHHIRRVLGEPRPVFFIDNHLFINAKWTKELLRRIIKEKFRFAFIAFGQYFIGKDPEMLDLLREAGFLRIFVGFESINPNTLKEFNKRQAEAEMRFCIEQMHKHGVDVHGSFMLGGETDTEDVAEATIKFAVETDICTASFFCLTEYPFELTSTTPVTNMLPPHRLLADNLDYYNLNFVSIYPRMMRPSRLQERLIEAHERFYHYRRGLSQVWRGNYHKGYERLMGYWSQRRLIQQMRDYLPYLRMKEEGKYDDKGNLIEDALSREPKRFSCPYPTLYDDVYFGMRRTWKATDWATFSPTTGKAKPLHFELPTYFEHVPASGEDFARALVDYRAPSPADQPGAGTGAEADQGLVQIRGLGKAKTKTTPTTPNDAPAPEKWRW